MIMISSHLPECVLSSAACPQVLGTDHWQTANAAVGSPLARCSYGGGHQKSDTFSHLGPGMVPIKGADKRFTNAYGEEGKLGVMFRSGRPACHHRRRRRCSFFSNSDGSRIASRVRGVCRASSVCAEQADENQFQVRAGRIHRAQCGAGQAVLRCCTQGVRL